MKTRLNYSAFLLAVLFFSSAFAQKESKQSAGEKDGAQIPTPKLDRHGDPLPEGALAPI